MDRLQELRKKQKELDEELDKVVQEIYDILSDLKIGDLLYFEGNYFKILDVHKYKAKVLVYSFNKDIPYVDVKEYNTFQLDMDKINDDNGTLNKIIKYLSNVKTNN